MQVNHNIFFIIYQLVYFFLKNVNGVKSMYRFIDGSINVKIIQQNTQAKNIHLL